MNVPFPSVRVATIKSYLDVLGIPEQRSYIDDEALPLVERTLKELGKAGEAYYSRYHIQEWYQSNGYPVRSPRDVAVAEADLREQINSDFKIIGRGLKDWSDASDQENELYELGCAFKQTEETEKWLMGQRRLLKPKKEKTQAEGDAIAWLRLACPRLHEKLDKLELHRILYRTARGLDWQVTIKSAVELLNELGFSEWHEGSIHFLFKGNRTSEKVLKSTRQKLKKARSANDFWIILDVFPELEKSSALKAR